MDKQNIDILIVSGVVPQEMTLSEEDWMSLKLSLEKITNIPCENKYSPNIIFYKDIVIKKGSKKCNHDDLIVIKAYDTFDDSYGIQWMCDTCRKILKKIIIPTIFISSLDKEESINNIENIFRIYEKKSKNG